MRKTGVTYTFNGQIAELRMDDGKVNAISRLVLDALNDGLTRAENEAKAVLLLGRPGCFSAGFDLRTLGLGTRSARDLAGMGGRLLIRMMRLQIPVVAGCTGHALALGALMLLAADARIGAAGSFKLGLTEVSIGLPLPRFAAELAEERLDRRSRLRVALFAEPSGPQGAVDEGLLDVVVPESTLEAEARARAMRFAGLPQPAFAETKRRLRGERAERARAGLARDVEDFGD